MQRKGNASAIWFYQIASLGETDAASTREAHLVGEGSGREKRRRSQHHRDVSTQRTGLAEHQRASTRSRVGLGREAETGDVKTRVFELLSDNVPVKWNAADLAGRAATEVATERAVMKLDKNKSGTT